MKPKLCQKQNIKAQLPTIWHYLIYILTHKLKFLFLTIQFTKNGKDKELHLSSFCVSLIQKKIKTKSLCVRVNFVLLLKMTWELLFCLSQQNNKSLNQFDRNKLSPVCLVSCLCKRMITSVCCVYPLFCVSLADKQRKIDTNKAKEDTKLSFSFLL